MADEPVEPAPSVEDTQATPPVEGTEQAEHSPETVDWEPRYKELQSTYTQSQQELAQLRQFQQQLASDPETQTQAFRELAEALGYELPEDEEPDPNEQLDQRLSRLEQEQQQAAEQQELDQAVGQIDQFVTNEFKSLGEKWGRDLDDREQKVLLSHAISSFPPGEDGMPQVQAAFEDLTGLRDGWQKEHISSKRAPIAPQAGKAGSETVDLNDTEARVARTQQIFEAARASEQ